MVKCERPFPPPPSLEKRKSYNEPDTVQQLKSIFHNKCYICEMQDLQDGIIEHLIPHGGNSDLKFDWENLFWACNRCNSIQNRQEYEGKIIDCCKVDPEKHLRCIYDPYTKQITVIPKDRQETSKMTAQLITETYNLADTGIREHSLSQRLRAFQEEWDTFFKLLNQYRKDKSRYTARKIKSKLSVKTAFAAIKRDYIRQHPNEYKDFQELVAVSKESD